MPDHRFETPDTEPLFPEDDPLTITIPGGGTFRCLDRANPPLEGAVNPETRPVSYTVELLARQIVEDERDAFRSELVAALDENRVMVGTLIDVARWVAEQRADAEKAALARVVDRPTKARRPSTR